MKKSSISVALGALILILASCQKSNEVKINYSSVVLQPEETVVIKISGGQAWIASDNTHLLHAQDSVCTLSHVQRHSLEITGCKLGQDTLRLRYGRSIYNNGEHLDIPVECVFPIYTCQPK